MKNKIYFENGIVHDFSYEEFKLLKDALLMFDSSAKRNAEKSIYLSDEQSAALNDLLLLFFDYTG